MTDLVQNPLDLAPAGAAGERALAVGAASARDLVVIGPRKEEVGAR